MVAIKGSELWQRLRAARRAAKITQEQLGEKVGVTRAAVSQWEHPDKTKRTQPRWEMLAAVSKVTGAPLDWLHDDSAPLDPSWVREEDEIVPGGKVVSLFGAMRVPDFPVDSMVKEYVPIKRMNEPFFPVSHRDEYSTFALRRESPYLSGIPLEEMRVFNVLDDVLASYGVPAGATALVDTSVAAPTGAGLYLLAPAMVLRYLEVDIETGWIVQPEGRPLSEKMGIAGRAIGILRRV